MNSLTTVITILENGQSRLPSEIQEKIKKGDRYRVSIGDNSIILQKLEEPIDIEDWFQRVESLGTDLEQPSLAEISEMVKEMRREKLSNYENRPLWFVFARFSDVHARRLAPYYLTTYYNKNYVLGSSGTNPSDRLILGNTGLILPMPKEFLPARHLLSRMTEKIMENSAG